MQNGVRGRERAMPTIYIEKKKSNRLSRVVPRHPSFEKFGAQSSSEQPY